MRLNSQSSSTDHSNGLGTSPNVAGGLAHVLSSGRGESSDFEGTALPLPPCSSFAPTTWTASCTVESGCLFLIYRDLESSLDQEWTQFFGAAIWRRYESFGIPTNDRRLAVSPARSRRSMPSSATYHGAPSLSPKKATSALISGDHSCPVPRSLPRQLTRPPSPRR